MNYSTSGTLLETIETESSHPLTNMEIENQLKIVKLCKVQGRNLNLGTSGCSVLIRQTLYFHDLIL